MFNQEVINIITVVANNNGIEPAKLLAVADVESAGVAFWKVGGVDKPAIRFEGHYFYARLTGAKLATAIQAGLANKKPGAVKNPNSFAARYALLDRAIAIDPIAALESTSYGLGQVMCANWKALGYASPQALVDACQTVAGQVELMLAFIEENDLTDDLQNGSWTTFARGYNGKGQKGYDKKIAAAYKKYNNLSPSDIRIAEIKQIQLMLNKVGDYKLNIDGDAGDKTDTAVRDFQLKNGLKVDGVVGPLTRAELEKQYLEINKKKDTNTAVVTTGGGLAGTAITEAAKNIQAINPASTVIQFIFIGLILLGVLITLKTVFWNKS